MKLKKYQFEQLQEALLDAYDRDGLRRMVRLGLDKPLSDITTARTDSDVVFDLIEWAEKSDNVPALVAAAQQYNTQNVAIQQVAQAAVDWLASPNRTVTPNPTRTTHAAGVPTATGAVGTSVGNAKTRVPDAHQPVPNKQVARKHRPLSVTVLAMLALLAAGSALIFALQMLHWLPVVFGWGQFFANDLVGAILWGIMFLAYLWGFRKLWILDPGGLPFVIVISVLNLILSSVSILGGSYWLEMSSSILLSGFILIFCLVPATRSAFDMAAEERITS